MRLCVVTQPIQPCRHCGPGSPRSLLSPPLSFIHGTQNDPFRIYKTPRRHPHVHRRKVRSHNDYRPRPVAAEPGVLYQSGVFFLEEIQRYKNYKSQTIAGRRPQAPNWRKNVPRWPQLLDRLRIGLLFQNPHDFSKIGRYKNNMCSSATETAQPLNVSRETFGFIPAARKLVGAFYHTGDFNPGACTFSLTSPRLADDCQVDDGCVLKLRSTP